MTPAVVCQRAPRCGFGPSEQDCHRNSFAKEVVVGLCCTPVSEGLASNVFSSKRIV